MRNYSKKIKIFMQQNIPTLTNYLFLLIIVFLIIKINSQNSLFYDFESKYDDIIVKNINSIVYIETFFNRQNSLKHKFVRAGTGFIIDKEGYILTNSHLVNQNTKYILVTFQENKRIEAKIVWEDKKNDLLIIKINECSLNSIIFGESNKMKVGLPVFAIGNPNGIRYRNTVTFGIISGMNRVLEEENYYLTNLLQIDAAINEGNSGGPLINDRGECIGIVTAKFNKFDGVGFAIPIDIVKPVLKSIKKMGYFKTIPLGIRGFDKFMNQDFNDIFKGFRITYVINDSIAWNNGLKVGDTILEINGNEIVTLLDLETQVYNVEIGNKIDIKYSTNNNEIRKISFIYK